MDNTPITLHSSFLDRMAELRAKRGEPALMLKIIVDGGGCSGFQYVRELVTAASEKDIVIEDAFITDEMSIPFMKGSTIKYEETLMGSDFVIDNPNTVSGCSCGESFTVKS